MWWIVAGVMLAVELGFVVAVLLCNKDSVRARDERQLRLDEETGRQLQDLASLKADIESIECWRSDRDADRR